MLKAARGAVALVVGLAQVAVASEAAKKATVSANGSSFAYVEQGDGPPVILVHGSVSDYREWAKQMAPLARHYRVIAYSRRYHWPNLPPDAGADANLERQVDDLAAIITTMRLAPAHVVGHSIGGAIALHLARRHPELVRSLILIEPAVIGVLGALRDDDPVSREAQGIRAAMKDAFASGDAEGIVRTYAAHVAPGELEQASPEIRQMLLANVPAFQLDNTSRRPPFTCEDANQVGVPALVVSGGRSPMGLQKIAETVARCMSSAKLVSIPEATHWIQGHYAQAFNEAALTFLEGHAK